MSNFTDIKLGDKVKRVGLPNDGGMQVGEIGTVIRKSDYYVYVDTYPNSGNGPDYLEIVDTIIQSKFASVIKEVSTPEWKIVKGTVVLSRGSRIFVSPFNYRTVLLDTTNCLFDSMELREAAELLNALADVLEDKDNG